jgi:aspartate/methionine/tyrosine aminotransferase
MLHIAERIRLLGTETAFAVSDEAAVYAARGKKIYPFHIGDLNFHTPPRIIEATVKAMYDGKTGYCPNAGIPILREALATDINKARGTSYTMDNVVIQPGGKPTIGKFLLAMMNPGDEVLYPNPGYPIYESLIEFNGGTAVPYTYVEGENGFIPDLEMLENNITRRTKILILNDPQNPTAAACSYDQLKQLAGIAIKNDLVVLSDEAYFDIRYEGKSISIASFPGMAERTVILYTFSKKFAMSGWRLGATVAPKEIAQVIAKLNVNDESCTNHFIQYGALEGIINPGNETDLMLATLKERRDVGAAIMNSIPGIHCFIPMSSFYLYPNVTELMSSRGFSTYESFQKDLLHNTGVSFCTRLHFGRPMPEEKNKYIRLAYSGISVNEIREGLAVFKDYMNATEQGKTIEVRAAMA